MLVCAVLRKYTDFVFKFAHVLQLTEDFVIQVKSMMSILMVTLCCDLEDMQASRTGSDLAP